MELQEAIATRFSARAFLDIPVPKQTIEEILRLASRAPSGSNMQPWKVYVAGGSKRDELIEEALASATQGKSEPPEYPIYPAELPPVYSDRRFETGMALYEVLGIDRADKVARNKQLLQNYRLFGAPVGLIFTVEKRFVPSQLPDLGMFMQNVMLLARDHGLHSCPQAAWQIVNRTVHRVMEIPDEEIIYAGLSLGYLDTDHLANGLKLDRAPLEDYVHFMGFDS